MKQVTVMGVIQRAKTQRVKQGYGPGAHGQNVPDDAANSGGGPLERLYR
jgi:hypothetical protein